MNLSANQISAIRQELLSRISKLKHWKSPKLFVQERQKGRIAAYQSVLKMLPSRRGKQNRGIPIR